MGWGSVGVQITVVNRLANRPTWLALPCQPGMELSFEGVTHREQPFIDGYLIDSGNSRCPQAIIVGQEQLGEMLKRASQVVIGHQPYAQTNSALLDYQRPFGIGRVGNSAISSTSEDVA